ncbi:peptidoglycan/LPS O-acetylase OafA/YrhL [Leptospira meyeri]|uniref:Peptidoglycan/LPS O-acetylase OafA/YrhL n=1 Tax=Leptospira meyeri TaxID=29508 RepID=A0A4R8MT43_LEPME|nr:acyltransferase [Leptospira meyeri]EKJ88656.1 acyltransferase [Leptospira meyeri serovar Hardjo str. Went 5]TDY71218.1 peptidoglycan/LPS O-acetylase OafA/YrhL [Leptospira meyeri]
MINRIIYCVNSVFEKKPYEHENLNGVRAISIIAVVVFHVWVTVKPLIQSDSQWLVFFLSSLSSGVDFFFLLSGFLIYGGLRREYERKGKINISNFFIKRSLRIYPAFYFALAVLYFFKFHQLSKFNPDSIHDPNAMAMFEEIRIGLSNVWVDALYLTDLMHVPVVYNGGWSLSIEEHFYMVLPFICIFFFFQISFSQRLIFYFFGFAIALFNRYYISFPEPNLDAVYMIYCRFDSILYGMFVYEFYHRFPWSSLEFRGRNLLLFFLLLLSGILIVWMHQIDSSSAFALIYRPTLVSIGFGILMYFSFFNQIIKSFFSLSLFRPFARLGYTAYLWHIIVIPLVAKKVSPLIFREPNMISVSVAFFWVLISTFLVSYVVYLVIELPFLQWKERLVHPEKIQ